MSSGDVSLRRLVRTMLAAALLAAAMLALAGCGSIFSSGESGGGGSSSGETLNTLIENEADKFTAVFLVIAAGFIVLTLPTGLLFGALAKKNAVKR